MLFSNHSAYDFNEICPGIVRGFNLGPNTIALVCTAPHYVISALITLAIADSSYRVIEQGWRIIAWLLRLLVS